MTFRDAHAWLRGYSDRLRGIGDCKVWPDNRAAYERGNRGAKK